jgi:hypothetical protein
MRGLRARQLCPVTCGCKDPLSSLALFLPKSGCGELCLQTPDYEAALAQAPCEDVSADDPTFNEYVDAVVNASVTWPNDWKDSGAFTLESFRRLGCPYVTMTAEEAWANGAYDPQWGGLDFCKEDRVFYPIKPLSYFCPVSCGCRSGDPHCPGTCPCADECNSTDATAAKMNTTAR